MSLVLMKSDGSVAIVTEGEEGVAKKVVGEGSKLSQGSFAEFNDVPTASPAASLNVSFGSISELQGFRTTIDNWSVSDLGMKGFRGLLEWDESDWRCQERFKQMDNLREIGIINREGKLTWCKWWQITSLNIDFLRYLGKGSRFRMVYKGSERAKSKCEGDTVFSNFLEACELDDKVTSPFRNSCNYALFRRYVTKLKDEGWLVRKEDRGDRFVLCSVVWEEMQLRTVLSGKVEVTPMMDKQYPRLYFLPKTHKNSKIIGGRPIVSWWGIKQPEWRKLKREVETWMKTVNGFDEKSAIEVIANGISTHGNKPTVVGDVCSLFTSIPRDDFRVFAYECFKEDVAQQMINFIEASDFRFYGVAWKWIDGLDMGSHLSPVFARAYLSWKEDKVDWKKATGKRYVDDVVIRGGVGDDVEYLKLKYERAVYPLTMEWRNDRNVMDSKWDGSRLEFNSRGRRFADLDVELPGSVHKGVVRQAVKRIEERMGVLVKRILWRVPSNTINEIRNYVGEKGVKLFQTVKEEGFLWSAEGRSGAIMHGLYGEGAVRRFLVGIDNKPRDNTVAYIELTWNPWFETVRGSYVKSKFIDTIQGVLGKKVELRWRYLSMKSMAVCMWKEAIPRGRNMKSKVADEDYRGVVETGV